MSPHSSTPSSPRQQPNPMQPELVQVDTALTVLSQVNLLKESNALALDIGGSLAKLIYLQPVTSSNPNPPPLRIHQVDGSVATALSVSVPSLEGILHFFAFESRNIDQLLAFIRKHWLSNYPTSNSRNKHIRATGGGSYKYANNFLDQISVTLSRLDEMACTVAGLNFLLTFIEDEVYVYNPPKKQTIRAPFIERMLPHACRRFIAPTENPFPYLLVNIGSGVSIVKVTGHGQYERVSGSSLGGGTFWGLARMLLDCATFDDVIDLTHKGDNTNVDMLVGDIYGGSYSKLGLDAEVIAASFGKATMRGDYTRQPSSTFSLLKDRFKRAISGTADLWLSFLSVIPGLSSLLKLMGVGNAHTNTRFITTNTGGQYRPEDIALSLLRMVSYNIGQIAYLNARVHNLDRIYFGGNFIRNHPHTIADISFAVDFWSKNEMEALFLRHDGYLGAIGALIGASSAAPAKHINRPKTTASNNQHEIQSEELKPNSSNTTPHPQISTDDYTFEVKESKSHSKNRKTSSDKTAGTERPRTDSVIKTTKYPKSDTKTTSNNSTTVSTTDTKANTQLTNPSSNGESTSNESSGSSTPTSIQSNAQIGASKTKASGRKRKSKKKKNATISKDETSQPPATSTEASPAELVVNGFSDHNNDESGDGSWQTVRRKRRNPAKSKTS